MNDEVCLSYSYDETICPICGGKIKHPYTGNVTSEQIEEDTNTCIWVEVTDESRSCLGYKPICRNIHIDKDDEGYTTINFIDVLNTTDTSLDSKIDLIYKLYQHYLPSINKEHIKITVQDGKITDVTVIGNDSIESLKMTLSIDENGTPILV